MIFGSHFELKDFTHTLTHLSLQIRVSTETNQRENRIKLIKNCLVVKLALLEEILLENITDKMKNNDAESEDSGPEVNSSDSDSEMSDSSDSSETTENELRIGKKISDYNEVLGELNDISMSMDHLWLFNHLQVNSNGNFRSCVRNFTRKESSELLLFTCWTSKTN